MIIAFAIAVILPALVSYLIGDKVTHAKNRLLHHYNGILFGIAAYWVSQFFNWVGFNYLFGISEAPFPTPLAFTNVMPVIATIILMTFVAISYAKKQKSTTSVLQHRPYQIVLVAAVIGAFVAPYISGGVDVNYLAISIAALAVPIIITAIAYKALAKHQPTRLARLSDAIIAMSMGWIATWLASSFISFIQLPYQIAGILAYVIGLTVFVIYLYTRNRKSL